MCGIFGYIDFKGKFSNSNFIGLMSDSQKHRGPDGFGAYDDKYFFGGMNRLSIIDVATGNQPLYSADKSLVTFCNGEIYNYIELRKELQGLGCSFRTSSDVETIPFLYQKHGIDFIQKLNGMYAISLYDTVKKELILFRDRLGIKPIYYYHDAEIFAYSSELKSLLLLPMIRKKINFQSLSTYLDLMYIPTPLTPFYGIHKLPSGSYLKVNKSNARIVKYWNLEKKSINYSDEVSATKQIFSLFNESIDLQLRSDVPVGAYLSGGIDSSAVVAVASGKTKTSLQTYHLNWGSVKSKMNEKYFADIVSQKFHTIQSEQSIQSNEFINLIPRLVWHLDEPMADAAFIPTYSLAKLASKNVKVILSGAGGDELFGGYSNHIKPNFIKYILQRVIRRKDICYSNYDRWVGDQSEFKKIFPWYTRNFFKENYDMGGVDKKLDWFDRCLKSDIEQYMQDNILMLTDKMSMAASVECRVPFLDHRLVEYTFSLQSNMKIKGNEQKYILKKAFDLIIPKEILYRKKEGFGVPIEHWVNLYKNDFNRIILEKPEEGLINYRSEALQSLLSKKVLSQIESWLYWKIFIFSIWIRIHLNGEDYQSICILDGNFHSNGEN